jgi:oligopeptide/dipeptide ABC transporter ATP-binding protein
MPEQDQAQKLIEINDLHIQFSVRNGIVKAVDGISFDIHRGQTVGLIGESGCGKSVTARAILQMIPKPGKVTKGQVLYYRPVKSKDGHRSNTIDLVDITDLDPDGTEIRTIRGGEIGMVFQEPMSSLTPVYPAGEHIREAVSLHRLVPKTVGAKLVDNIEATRHVSKLEARQMAIDLLHQVGIPKPEQRVDSYPHQLSGGQRQRVMIAVALSCQPAMLIADEPTTALDVSIEAQILDLMRELQQTTNMAILFITHNLGVIAGMADEVVVMYLGREVERAKTNELFHDPRHPYTVGLLKSIPHIGKKTGENLSAIEGMIPDPFHLPTGCLFHPRCSDFMLGKCDEQEPSWKQVAADHWVRCWKYES